MPSFLCLKKLISLGSIFIVVMKPSEQTTIRAKVNKFLCPYSFGGIMLFGTLYTREQSHANSVNRSEAIDTTFKCHEMIHVKQAENVKDSWLLYYLLYIWQWICNLPLIFRGLKMPYRFIAFELEAYFNQDEFTYPLSQEGGCALWRKMNNLSLSRKYKLAGQYKKTGAAFSRFVKRAIDVDTL